MKLRISGFVEDSIVDGPGLRLAVFTQGCNHGCPGCHNPETHDPSGGCEVEVDEIIRKLENNPIQSGITITGGEPLLQPEAVAELASKSKSRGYDVCLYTGFTWEELMKDCDSYDRLLADVDILVDGPFDNTCPTYGRGFKGSENQRVIDVKESLRSHAVKEIG